MVGWGGRQPAADLRRAPASKYRSKKFDKVYPPMPSAAQTATPRCLRLRLFVTLREGEGAATR